MAIAAKNEFDGKINENQKEIREMVLAGLEQAKQGKVEDFDVVFDRLEKKYKDAIL
ncbi:MAG: hypothetical protein UDG86_15905 [Lachnospiraceae bacterium]|jgi:hypothetical protein|nr:hypothetical protein [Lachnospiraceae bacterium]